MVDDNTPKKTLKQEKLWLIDEKEGEIKYDVTDDINHGWWEKIPDSKEYGTITQSVNAQDGEYARISKTTGIQWFDHHSQAFNDSGRHHPQRHDVDKTDDDSKIKS